MDETYTVVPDGKALPVVLRNWHLRPRPNSWHVHLVGISADNPVDALEQYEFVTSILRQRVNKHRMLSGSGRTYEVQGPCNMDKMLALGYPKMLAKVFASGFPTEWKEFLKDEAERRMNEQSSKKPEDQAMPLIVTNEVAQRKSDGTKATISMPQPEVGQRMEATSNEEPVFRVPAVPKRPKFCSERSSRSESAAVENVAATLATVQPSIEVPAEQPFAQPKRRPEKQSRRDQPVVSDRVLRTRQLPDGVYAMDKMLVDMCKRRGAVQPPVLPPAKQPVKKCGVEDATNKKPAGKKQAKDPKAPEASQKEREPKRPAKRPKRKEALEPITESVMMASKPAVQRKKEMLVTNVTRQKIAEERPNPAEESMLRRSSRLNRNDSVVCYVDSPVRNTKRRGQKLVPAIPNTMKKAPISKTAKKQSLKQPEMQIVASVRKIAPAIRKGGEKKNHTAKQPKRVSVDVAKKVLLKRSIPAKRSPISKKDPPRTRRQPPRRSTRNFTVIEESGSEEEEEDSPSTPPTVKKKPKPASKPSAVKVTRKSTRLTITTPAKKRASIAKKQASLRKARKVPEAKKTPANKNRNVGWWRKEVSQVQQLQQNAIPARLRQNGLFALSPSVANLKLAEVDWDMDEVEDFEPVEHTDTTRTFRMSAHSRKTKKRVSEFDFEPSNAKSAMERLNFQGYLQNEKHNAVKNPIAKPSTNSSIWSTGASASATYMNIVLPSIPAQLRDDDEF
ncbi:hypothetical protein RvY_15931 [Ramazzottius varieornatus]|uniref:SANTA domain-containing protein n=1 Tax=Ramazzottius varieornatus TaxID=947166 RepID=A0A1D1VWN7_RAMVA|nr:hypothetical protein RvY_15931 [Ramazzottius varieornatus]